MGNRTEKPVETPCSAAKMLTAEEYAFLLKLFGVHPGPLPPSTPRASKPR